MDKLVIASKNKGKINEIKDILKWLPFEILSMNDAGYDDEIEESGNTFDENAMLKARAVFSHTGGMVLADDSGLEIDFLQRRIHNEYGILFYHNTFPVITDQIADQQTDRTLPELAPFRRCHLIPDQFAFARAQMYQHAVLTPIL